MEIIGEARTGDETISLATRLQPDVVLMDIKMPGTNGIEATRALMQAQPQIRILMVTLFEDDGFVFAAMRSGARGYVLKDANQEELVRAVRAVHRGEVIYSPAIAQRMIHYFAVLPATVSQLAFPTLTDRERDILQLMAQGESNTNTAIAKRLSLSLKTIQNHVSRIFSKLQVTDRAKAIIQARDAGLGYS